MDHAPPNFKAEGKYSLFAMQLVVNQHNYVDNNIERNKKPENTCINVRQVHLYIIIIIHKSA